MGPNPEPLIHPEKACLEPGSGSLSNGLVSWHSLGFEVQVSWFGV